MQPWRSAPLSMRRTVRGIFFDIDDTLSTDGKITDLAYRALWRAHRAGLTLVPITGRPAGWADHIGRMWPVAGVVAENGALATYWAAGKLRTLFLLDAPTRARNRRRLSRLRREILRAVPGAAVASDQPYRLFDLAIDYCEDVPALPHDAAQRIVELFEQRGASAKISSIHVNGWFGRYDKLGMCRRFCRDVLGFDLDRARRRYLFVGDSPNDAPMFEYFPNSVGVANVRRFADRLAAAPRYVTRRRCGAGFAEVVAAVLNARAGSRPAR
ncbi:MAG: HAD-IIB family hydrolase [Deltaproteobacteria bacterium]|nr:HAD-IIB family hydrolase [Deltaproteobacteria bacterium]